MPNWKARKIWVSITLFFIPFSLSSLPLDKDTGYINDIILKAASMQVSDPKAAYNLAIEASTLSIQMNFKKGLGSAYMRMGSIQNYYGNNDSALFFLRRAEKIRREIKDFAGLSRCYYVISFIFKSMGKKDSVFSNLFLASHFAEKTKDTVYLSLINIALGDSYLDYNDPPTAFNYYKRAEHAALLLENNIVVSNSYGGLGKYFIQTNQFDSASFYFRKKMTIDDELGNKPELALDKSNIGICYENLQQYNLSYYYHKSSLNDFIDLDMKEMQALQYFNIGSLYFNTKKPDSAIIAFQSALKFAQEIKDLNRIAACYEYLSKAYFLKKDYKNAYQAYTSYSSVNDSILNVEKITSISEMQTKYDTEKKVQQINILNEQNKRKVAERNIFIVGTVLFLFLGLAILIGLMQTRKAKKVSEELLLNILPEEVADELKVHGKADAKYFDDVTVLFTDFKDFTQISEKLNPKELVSLLDTCFKAFDAIITKYDIEKIKTIGDSYMCAGGLPTPHPNSCKNTVLAGLEMQSFIESLSQERIAQGQLPIKMRLGIHTGPVVAGIVGDKKYSYDIWGDTVNTASRMESSGEIGKVNISESTYEIVKDSFNFEYRGKVKAKNKGEIDMYFVEKKINTFT